MMDQLMTAELLEEFRYYLMREERSGATINKYMHDVKCFQGFAAGRPVDKAITVEYKAYLQEEYALTSANSMIAVLNTFFRFAGWPGWTSR